MTYYSYTVQYKSDTYGHEMYVCLREKITTHNRRSSSTQLTSSAALFISELGAYSWYVHMLI
jgi:hypothetical protein